MNLGNLGPSSRTPILLDTRRSVSPVPRLFAPSVIAPEPAPAIKSALKKKNKRKKKDLTREGKKFQEYRNGFRDKGKTYFGYYVSKKSKEITGLPLSDDGRRFLDQMLFGLFNRMCREAAVFNRPDVRLSKKKQKRTVISKIDLETGLRLICPRQLYALIWTHYNKTKEGLQFVLDTEGEDEAKDELEDASLA